MAHVRVHPRWSRWEVSPCGGVTHGLGRLVAKLPTSALHCAAIQHGNKTTGKNKHSERSCWIWEGGGGLLCCVAKQRPPLPRPTRDDDEKPERRLQEYLLITNKNVLCWNSRTLNFYRLERLIHFLNISILYTYISNFFFLSIFLPSKTVTTHFWHRNVNLKLHSEYHNVFISASMILIFSVFPIS